MKMLVVDNDAGITGLIRVIMKSMDYEVLEAGTGSDGFDIAKAELPDIIFLDLMMPDVNGYELLEKLKGDSTTRNIPVVFLTAKSLFEDDELKYFERVDGCIFKPFDHNILISTISEILDKSE